MDGITLLLGRLLRGTGILLWEGRHLRIKNVNCEAYVHYEIHSFSRYISLACSPIIILKMDSKLAHSQVPADCPAFEASQMLSSGDFEQFLRCQSGCSLIEYPGSSYIIHSRYFLVASRGTKAIHCQQAVMYVFAMKNLEKGAATTY
jgi:hypothetical protein